MIPKTNPRTLLLASAVALMLFTGCTDIVPPIPVEEYKDPTSPANVLDNLRISYRNKDEERYAQTLADDFTFHFDPATLSQRPELPQYWNRFEDSTQTARLFNSDQIGEIRIQLTFNRNAEDVNEVGREHWKLIYITNELLEVDQKPQPGEEEGTTFLVEGQIQKFYFRRGKSEGDTLGSPSSQDWFITEWRDQGSTQ